MKRMKHIAAIVLLTASAGASAAPVDYKFDSVSRFDTGPDSGMIPDRVVVKLTGILENATTPTMLDFNLSIGNEYQAFASRCVPLFLTMMEKSGRYWLNVRIDTAAGPMQPASQMLSCGLEVKS